ncbi:hypothetical protein D3C79_839330 [compost metagenome]
MSDGTQARCCPPHAKKGKDAVEQERHRHVDAGNLQCSTLWPEKIGQGEGDADQGAQQWYANLPADVAAGQAVGNHAADQGAEGGASAADHANQKAGLLDVQTVRADEKTRAPGANGVAGNRRGTARQH